MTKYIDAEKLKAEIERLNSLVPYENNDRHDDGLHDAYKAVKNVIDSLQQEQLECSSSLVDFDAVMEDFMAEVYRVLDVDPTNDKANAIIDAFDSLPTVSQEHPEVDLDEEIDKEWNPHFYLGWDENSCLTMNRAGFVRFARHFYELGRNTKKQ